MVGLGGLELRLHPYQQSGAHRYATLRFCRSRATVTGEGMRSNRLVLTGGGRVAMAPRKVAEHAAVTAKS